MTTNGRVDAWMRFFFSNYLWLGIVLVLLSIVLEGQFKITDLWFTSLTGLIQNIGIAIVVAAIFTFAAGTSEFVNKIRELLQDIVVSRNFLGNIDAESKREALSSLIKPSTEEKRIYSNIEDYLNTYINQAMDVTGKCVRSNYAVNVRAYIDKSKNRVICESKITYRLFPTKQGYGDIKVGFFEKEMDSTCDLLIINTPHGNRSVITEFNYEAVEIDAGKARLATIDLSTYQKDCSHLDIEINMVEPGFDHWKMLSFSALQPTDGFRHYVRCEDGLEVKDFHTFVFGAQVYIDAKGESELTISCNEWVNEGTGLSVLISNPLAHLGSDAQPIIPPDLAQEAAQGR
ncbi:MAG: hypothetical protein IPN75_11730 [Dechloromonas sp.]|uniref:Uncharacterized protein n=1 Tax=Candidatus Dechloromonas phosphorivorans TaxID=2899244 RepID=A0A9D7QI43_9RHOO|nr:hypothetical protein [Candidatus Dechloromonas phosphorivorans]